MNAVLLLQFALIILISLGLQRLSLSIGAPSLLALLALPPGNSGNPGLTSSADAVKSAQMDQSSTRPVPRQSGQFHSLTPVSPHCPQGWFPAPPQLGQLMDPVPEQRSHSMVPLPSQ